MKQYVYEVEIQVTLNKKVTIDSSDVDTAIDVALAYVESLYESGADYKVIRHMNMGDADEGREYETVPY
jgi:hypothetical protein